MRCAHPKRSVGEIAETLRNALRGPVDTLRAAASASALELDGHCQACAFHLCVVGTYSPTPRPRSLMLVRDLGDEIEGRFLDGGRVEPHFRREYLCEWSRQ
jgi:hypothetical protein